VNRNFFSFILGVKVSLELHETSGSKWNLYRIFILMWLFICIMCPYTEHKFGLIHRIPFGNETLETSLESNNHTTSFLRNLAKFPVLKFQPFEVSDH